MPSLPSNDPTEKTSFKKILNHLVAGGLTVLVLAIIFGAFALFRLDRMVEQLELRSYDLRTQVQWGEPNKHPSPDVVILQFDEASLNLLNDEFGVWPWPRDIHARMIHFLNKVGTRSLLYDIMFVAHRKGNEEADQLLVDAFQQYDNVYLSMNFDNELEVSQKLGKDLTPQDIELLKPLSIHLNSELDKAPKGTPLKLRKDPDGTVFFDNNHITFDHYRSIMPSLLATGRNIGIINHGADDDGVSRSNPLFFRFEYQPFIKTQAFPLTRKDDQWHDAQGNLVNQDGYLFERSEYLPAIKQADGSYLDQHHQYPQRVDQNGYLMDGYGNYIYKRAENRQFMYFPYLGLRAMLDLKFGKNQPKLTLTKEGHLKFENYDIPLAHNGDFLVNWYNINFDLEKDRKNLRSLQPYRNMLLEHKQKLEAELQSLPKNSTQAKKAQHELNQVNDELQKVPLAQQFLEEKIKTQYTPYIPKPYQTISAWEVIRTMKKDEAGLPLTDEDLELKSRLKDKIIFIGATAVASFDIKNTPIHPILPGVVLQANLFDNLYQNNDGYTRRVDPNINFMISLFICVLAASCAFKMRSALAGLLTAANIAVLYVLLTVILYQSMNLWINIAMPLVSLIITITITFMLKYFLRDKDYEKTYALATTDSMTGLYNHRFFQEHMRRSIDQANRFKHKYSLLLIDIDFFKKFNDTYGHQAGDEVLRQVARKLQKSVRNIDVVARYGGEEMAIVLDRTTEEEALLVANKIVQAVAEEAYPIAEGVAKHVTISCGVATYPTHGESPSQLIEFADAGLYRAKENGRNQVGAQYESPSSPAASNEHRSDDVA